MVEWKSAVQKSTTMLWRPVQRWRQHKRMLKYLKYLLQISFLLINSEISRSDCMQRHSRCWGFSPRTKCATMMSWLIFFLYKQTSSFLPSIVMRVCVDNVKKSLLTIRVIKVRFQYSRNHMNYEWFLKVSAKAGQINWRRARVRPSLGVFYWWLLMMLWSNHQLWCFRTDVFEIWCERAEWVELK